MFCFVYCDKFIFTHDILDFWKKLNMPSTLKQLSFRIPIIFLRKFYVESGLYITFSNMRPEIRVSKFSLYIFLPSMESAMNIKYKINEAEQFAALCIDYFSFAQVQRSIFSILWRMCTNIIALQIMCEDAHFTTAIDSCSIVKAQQRLIEICRKQQSNRQSPLQQCIIITSSNNKGPLQPKAWKSLHIPCTVRSLCMFVSVMPIKLR